MGEQTAAGTELLRLASADNFRDVAGAGHRTRDGQRLRRGVFYRSNELRLSGEDLEALSGLGLTRIIDQRSQPEIGRHPDPELPDAEWAHFDAIGIPMEQVGELTTRAAAVDLMDRVYRGFVEIEHSREAFGGVLRALAEGGPQLFHCTAGKDRTGWTAALLLHVAGVEDAVIEADYLLSNELTAGSRARVEAALVEHLGADALTVFEPTLVVDAEYLHAAYDSIERVYGDRAAYLRDGLGLDDSVLDRLRRLLVEG